MGKFFIKRFGDKTIKQSNLPRLWQSIEKKTSKPWPLRILPTLVWRVLGEQRVKEGRPVLEHQHSDWDALFLLLLWFVCGPESDYVTQADIDPPTSTPWENAEIIDMSQHARELYGILSMLWVKQWKLSQRYLSLGILVTKGTENKNHDVVWFIKTSCLWQLCSESQHEQHICALTPSEQNFICKHFSWSYPISKFQ